MFSTIAAGIVAALAGFGGSIAVVLAAAAAVGASPTETTSWVTALCAAMAATTALLTVSSRIPITTAWSTPGAAVIAATAGTISFPAATGAFLVAAALVVLTALIRPLGQLVERIPLPIASGMLAGVLLQFVLAIFASLQAQPLLVLPLVALFLILRLWNPAMAALVVMIAGVAYAWGLGLAPMAVPFDVSLVALTAPVFDPTVLIGLAVPLYVVTMAGQNLAGAAVLRAAGYTIPFNRSLMVTGLASMLIAPFGGHTIGLSAIASAICTGPDTHPDPAKRWPAGVSLAITYTLITVFAGALVALFLALPPELMRTIAGLALMTSLIGALSSATGDPELRFAAILTFAVTASGLTIAGVGAAFWGLVAGLLALWLERAWPGRTLR